MQKANEDTSYIDVVVVSISNKGHFHVMRKKFSIKVRARHARKRRWDSMC